jgi:hypothetical protein
VFAPQVFLRPASPLPATRHPTGPRDSRSAPQLQGVSWSALREGCLSSHAHNIGPIATTSVRKETVRTLAIWPKRRCRCVPNSPPSIPEDSLQGEPGRAAVLKRVRTDGLVVNPVSLTTKRRLLDSNLSTLDLAGDVPCHLVTTQGRGSGEAKPAPDVALAAVPPPCSCEMSASSVDDSSSWRSPRRLTTRPTILRPLRPESPNPPSEIPGTIQLDSSGLSKRGRAVG